MLRQREEGKTLGEEMGRLGDREVCQMLKAKGDMGENVLFFYHNS